MMIAATTLVYDVPAAYVQSGPSAETSLEHQPASFRIRVGRGANTATSSYAISETDKVFFPHLTKLDRIETDSSLWVDKAPPPSQEAMGWARVIIQQLQDSQLPPSSVVASAEGGIAFCFLSGKKYADIECLNDGTILGLISDEYGRPSAWEIDQNPIDIEEATARIRRFIHALTAR